MFTERLKKYRQDLGLLQYEFAKSLGISESFYSMIENGRKAPSKNFLAKLSEHSGKPESYWIYGLTEYTAVTQEPTPPIVRLVKGGVEYKGTVFMCIEEKLVSLFNYLYLNRDLNEGAIKDLCYLLSYKQLETR